jgi:hypothetical protein
MIKSLRLDLFILIPACVVQHRKFYKTIIKVLQSLLKVTKYISVNLKIPTAQVKYCSLVFLLLLVYQSIAPITKNSVPVADAR